MTGSARHDKRYKASHPLQVRCDSWSDFVQLYAGDVSQGGMFIITDEPHEILSEIDVKLSLPETHEIQLRGRVVHVMTPEMAEAEGRQPGVGVEFKNITPEMWAQFMNMQNPMLQGMMGTYAEQSKQMFEKMQEQMQKQTEQMLGAFGIKR